MLVLVLAAVSCAKTELDTVNEISDHYTVPADAVQLTTLSASASTWAVDRRYFDLTFTGNGTTLETTLVGFDALLATGQYVLSEDVIGKAIAAKTKLNGAAVSSGFITVSKKAGKYLISASLGDAVLYWEGTLPFVADPAPTALPVLMGAQSNLGGGTPSLSITMATEGISQEYDMTTYQQVWKGEGGYLALDLYSEDGYLHEGTYLPCAEGGKLNPGEFGIGWDPGDIYNMGWAFTDWGTCWWTVSGGAATATKITDGSVTVIRTEDGWKIAWGKDYPMEYLFEGAIPALTKVEASPDFDFTYKVDIQDVYQQDQTGAYQVVPGVKKHAVTIANAESADVAYLELLLAEGVTDLAGSYVSTEYASAPGQLANGYYLDYSAYGYGIIEGGSWYLDGNGEKVYIAPGVTVEVTKLAEAAYQFAGEGLDIKASGEGYVPGSYKPGDDGPFSGTVLTDFLSLTSYKGYGISLAGVELATAGVSYTTEVDWTTWTATTTYTGEGNYVKLEYYCDDESGLPAPGTYTACATGGEVGVGEFGIGYDNNGNAYGSNWYAVSGGAATNQYITDGTLTVAVEGSTYTIILKSTVVNFKYVGPLSK